MAEENNKKETEQKSDTSDLQLVKRLMDSPDAPKIPTLEPQEEKHTKNDEIIDNCRPAQRMDVINSGRLGIYDKNGKYIIESEILNELRALPKVITEKVVDNPTQSEIYTLKTDIPEVLSLSFKFVVNVNGAKLYLVEEVFKEGGTYLEVYEERIDSINFVKVTPTHKEMLLRFNISEEGNSDDDDLGKRFEKGEFDTVVSRKVYLQMLAKIMRAEALQLENKVFDETMAYLKSKGVLGKKILSAFLVRLDKRKDVFQNLTSAERYRVLNDILIAAMKSVISGENLLNPEVRKVFDNVLNIRTDTVDWAYQNARRKISPSEIKTRVEILKSTKAASLKTKKIMTIKPMLKIKKEEEKAASDKNKEKEKGKPKPKLKPVKKPAQAPKKAEKFKLNKVASRKDGGSAKKKKRNGISSDEEFFLLKMMQQELEKNRPIEQQPTPPPPDFSNLELQPMLKQEEGMGPVNRPPSNLPPLGRIL